MNQNDNVVRGHFNNHEVPPDNMPQQMEDIVDLARAHGFDQNSYENLAFEPWLVSNGCSVLDYSGNLAAVEFDPRALYFAKVDGPLMPNPYVVVFKIEASFSYGEPWCFEMTVYYICHSDDPTDVAFDAYSVEPNGLVATIHSEYDEYVVMVNGSLRAAFLVAEIRDPLEALVSLFAMQASSGCSGAMNLFEVRP